MKAPVITIDGPSGTGKGTIASMLVEAMGWHFLDSGAVYRAVAWGALKYFVDPKNEKALVDLISSIEVKIIESSNKKMLHVYCNEFDVTSSIRIEEVGMLASAISSFPKVRLAVLPLQRSFRKNPGLVTDGRDMGTVIFPDADLKIYLKADLDVRAVRRFKQLQQKGIDISLKEVRSDLAKRDKQDLERESSPLRPAKDAFVIDTTHITADAVFAQLMSLVRENVV